MGERERERVVEIMHDRLFLEVTGRERERERERDRERESRRERLR